MNVLVLNPPFLKKFSRPQRSPAVTKSGTIYFPIWLAYAVGVLQQAGHQIAFFDAPADDLSLKDVISRVRSDPPGLIVMDTSTPSIANDLKVANDLRKVFPSAFIILVGTHVSALPTLTLEGSKSVDAIAIMEYEYTVRDLAEALERGKDLSTVEGVVYRSGDNIVTNPPREFIADLDELPFVSEVYKNFLNIERYFNPNALYPMVTLISSRGCPFRCIFCVYPQTLMGRRSRYRTAANVAAEMKYVVENFPNAKAIFFEDDTITSNKQFCVELCNEILKQEIKISWTANSRADMDLETLKLMKHAGCRMLCIGFESGNQDILDTMKKSMKIGRMRQFAEDAKKVGILIHGCFMVGFPGETAQTMRQTLDLAKDLNPDTAQFYPIMVYPGTDAYEWYERNGFIDSEDFSQWITSEGLHNSVVRTENLTGRQLVDFCDQARREFYLRPNYILRKLRQMILHPREIRRTVRSARTFFKYLFRGSFEKKCD